MSTGPPEGLGRRNIPLSGAEGSAANASLMILLIGRGEFTKCDEIHSGQTSLKAASNYVAQMGFIVVQLGV